MNPFIYYWLCDMYGFKILFVVLICVFAFLSIVSFFEGHNIYKVLFPIISFMAIFIFFYPNPSLWKEQYFYTILSKYESGQISKDTYDFFYKSGNEHRWNYKGGDN